MVDSWGKIPSGLAIGNIQDLGQYDECLAIRGPDFKGKYCIVNFPINLTQLGSILSPPKQYGNSTEKLENS